MKTFAKAWRERITIPTYEVGAPEKNPVFLEKRVYQGSSGAVYPYPVIESIADRKTDKTYEAVWMENEYIKVMILPELGGRVQMAYDKIRCRHFVYYNHVIKPALVGLAGPWISGGIEFNWPQHHRPSTYLPVDTTIEEHEDGSVTVWVNEIERMSRQKGMAGFTLHPGCAYLEIKGVLYNRTDVPQTFLWWANPAVAVNDRYQSVFPPDINAVFDHGKRAVSSFPIATGTYYKVDYSAGVDISNYRNIRVPTSYMAVNSKYDFEGGYENDTRAGMLHVASNRFSPGKKQWTWGNGDFGRAWDRNLTDEDGPYIELMAGVYTENQPDFSWLMPYEEKSFTQYFMPYRELGVVKQANRDVIMNITPCSPSGEGDGGGGNAVRLQIFVTGRHRLEIAVTGPEGKECFAAECEMSPEEVFDRTISIGTLCMDDLTVTIRQSGSYATPLVWHSEPDELRPLPDAAEAAPLPQETKTVEQLYLTGLHLEQYRHATWSALDYYEEGLRRDPSDYRCNNAMGLWYLRRGRFDKAEPYLRTAVRVLQKRNPNPYDGEPLYNLALCLKYQGKEEEAYRLFWKSTWNKGWADAGYFEAAQISVKQRRWADALDELDRCLCNHWHNHKARGLKVAVLRLMGRRDEAFRLIEESLACDPFNYVCRYEKYLLGGDERQLMELKRLLRGSCHNYDELALDYRHAGLEEEARAVWQLAIDEKAVSPMTYYFLGRYEEAEACASDYCFPNSLDACLALLATVAASPRSARACYYLGCLYYDKRQYELAVDYWQRSKELDAAFPTVWRNLALAYFNKYDRQEEAVRCMEQAFALDPSDARILMELDQLYKRVQQPHRERLARLERFPELVARRDDLLLERITLLNQLGRYEEAMTLLDGHVFHPWEGGEGKVPTQYQICRVELAKRLLSEAGEVLRRPDPQVNGGKATDAAGGCRRAVALLKECLEYPRHLGEGKLYGAQENDFYYFLGCAYRLLGEPEEARRCWLQAVEGPQEPAAAMYYNDAKPDKIFYQGLALSALGREAEARGRFHRLVDYGKQHLFDAPVMDYFAVSLPDLLIWEDSLERKNRIHCKYMLALGSWGLGEYRKARQYLAEVMALDINHQGAQALYTWMHLCKTD